MRFFAGWPVSGRVSGRISKSVPRLSIEISCGGLRVCNKRIA